MAKGKMLNNFEAVSQAVGSYMGMAQGLDERDYLEKIIKDAHKKTARKFDVAMAAQGSAGRMRHMYEYGVPGITEGPPKFGGALSPNARLWVHKLEGIGGNQEVSFSFRPAVNRNPNPTTKTTGVPSKYLKKISKRKYVFWNKATVMELGLPVEIKSKQPHGKLFVPFYGRPSRYRDNANKGFMMWNAAKYGSIETTPGRTTKGSFSKFWMGWWGSQGEMLIEREMATKIRRDVRYSELRAERASRAMVMKSPVANDILGTTKKAAYTEENRFGMESDTDD